MLFKVVARIKWLYFFPKLLLSRGVVVDSGLMLNVWLVCSIENERVVKSWE